MKKLVIFCLIVMGGIYGAPYRPTPLPTIDAKSDFQVKDFSHLLGKLQGISDNLLKMHFTLYEGYVKNTNTIAHLLRELRMDGKDKSLSYGALKRRFGWEYDGMYLHELYFENLGGKSALHPKSALYKKIVQDYGSYEAWESNFKATGLIRGIGWVILYQDPIEGLIYNVWVDEHNINHIAGGIPLLVMDVWEHAYITEYGLNRAKYIDAFFDNIDWQAVEERFSNR